ncbi:hypothetical protein BCR42DRAFT_445744 [Absidia repens]|uniref:Metal homeostatis protein bsd2 n=1 Tax=Absidia repens TaxID=90262 RepID=A0A1X2J479_9FUNG|nr:hypothetical protein BCR42DRAFT_445744 [Absidia repens]
MSRYQQVRTSADDEHLTTAYSNERSDINNIQRSQQRSDLEDTFGEAFDEDDEDDDTHHDEAQRLLHPPATNEHQLNSPSSHRPSQQEHHYPAVLPVRSTNDGVFSNMSAKPESESTKLDETPPAYDIAVADSTPPYWQTTVIAPLGMGDMILVEGLPVGSILGFAWNLLVSASFQFVGFMLTYLLHTSHAAKNGSLAGLGVSLVQTGFYIRSRESLVDDTNYTGDESNSKHKDQSTDGGESESLDADILSYILMIIGWFLVIRAVSDYARAKKMESIIGQEPTPESIV